LEGVGKTSGLIRVTLRFSEKKIQRVPSPNTARFRAEDFQTSNLPNFQPNSRAPPREPRDDFQADRREVFKEEEVRKKKVQTGGASNLTALGEDLVGAAGAQFEGKGGTQGQGGGVIGGAFHLVA
jgi:hypothetical protein